MGADSVDPPDTHTVSDDFVGFQQEVARLRGVEKACRKYAAEAEAAKRREGVLHDQLKGEVAAAISREDELLAQLRDMHNSVDTEITSLRQALADKDSFINDLAAAKHDLAAKLTELEASSNQETTHLSDLLEASESDCETRIASLTATLEATQQAQENLLQQLAVAKQDASAKGSLEAELQQAQTAVEELKREVVVAVQSTERVEAEQNVERDEYERLLGQRASDIDVLSKKVAQLSQVNAELSQENSELSNALKDAQYKLQQQSGECFEADSKRLASAEFSKHLSQQVTELTEENRSLLDKQDDHESVQEELHRLRATYSDQSQLKTELRSTAQRLEEALRAGEVSAKEIARLQTQLEESNQIKKRIDVVQAHSRHVESDGKHLRERVSMLERQRTVSASASAGDITPTPLSEESCDDLLSHVVGGGSPRAPSTSPNGGKESSSSPANATKSRSELVHQLWILYTCITKAAKAAAGHHSEIANTQQIAEEVAPGLVCGAMYAVEKSYKSMMTELKGAKGKAVWLVSNYLTEVEKLHLGIPMAYFEPDVKVITNLGLAPTKELDKELKRSGGYDFMKRNFTELVVESRRRQFPIEGDALPPGEVKAHQGRVSGWNVSVDSPPAKYLRSLSQSHRVRSASPDQAQSDPLVFVASSRDPSPSPTPFASVDPEPAPRFSRNQSATTHLIQRLRAQVENRW